MSLIVLNFHGLGEPHAGVPAGERPYWLTHKAFSDLLDRIAGDFDLSRFAFTFDDGNLSDMEAAEMLAARGATGRFFALAGRLHEDHYLDADDLRRLREMGMVVGLHGRDHVDWRSCDDQALESEIDAARGELEVALGTPITEVAIPFGRYDSRVISKLRQAGFARIHTSDGGFADPRGTVWNRNTLRNDMKEDAVTLILNGGWSLSQNFKRVITGIAKRHII